MGDLFTCPRYFSTTLRKKKENTDMDKKKLKLKKKKVEMNSCNSFISWLDDNGAIILTCELNYCKT